MRVSNMHDANHERKVHMPDVTKTVAAITNAAATHRGESPLMFHLATWIVELKEPESSDFLASDLTANLAITAALVAEELTQ